MSKLVLCFGLFSLVLQAQHHHSDTPGVPTAPAVKNAVCTATSICVTHNGSAFTVDIGTGAVQNGQLTLVAEIGRAHV